MLKPKGTSLLEHLDALVFFYLHQSSTGRGWEGGCMCEGLNGSTMS